jgi:hypothetical protein
MHDEDLPSTTHNQHTQEEALLLHTNFPLQLVVESRHSPQFIPSENILPHNLTLSTAKDVLVDITWIDRY